MMQNMSILFITFGVIWYFNQSRGEDSHFRFVLLVCFFHADCFQWSAQPVWKISFKACRHIAVRTVLTHSFYGL